MGYIENALVQRCATWIFALTLSALSNPVHAQKDLSGFSLNAKPTSSAALRRANEAAGGGPSESSVQAIADKRRLERANGTADEIGVKPPEEIGEWGQLLVKTACISASEPALHKSFLCPATECARTKIGSGFCKTLAFVARLSLLSYGILPFAFTAQTTKADVLMGAASRFWT